MKIVSKSITGQKKRTTPQSEWSVAGVPEYESAVDEGGQDLVRAKAIDIIADASSSAEDKAAAKNVIKNG